MALLKKLKKQKMAVGIVGQKIVLYGDNGTGKTTVAIEMGKAICKEVSSNPDAAPLVISFENGTNASDDFYYVDGTDYKQTREILSDINNEKNRSYVLETTPVIIVDGVEKIPTIAKNYVTTKKEIEVLGDLAYGKGYDIFKAYTEAPFIKLMAIKGVTVIFIYHAETDAETKYTIPSGSAKENGICKYIRDNSDAEFLFDIEELNKRATSQYEGANPVDDEMFVDIARYIVETQNASINKLQKTFGRSFNTIQAIIQKLEELGVVSENLGSRARNVLITPEELEDIIDNL